jgi:hypothetical protein
MSDKNWFKWLWAFLRYLPTYIRNKPVELGHEDGTSHFEQWDRHTLWALRPRWWGLMKNLECGCARRLGRIELYNLDCVKHTGFDWRAEMKELRDE